MQIQRTRISYLTGVCQSPEQLARLQEAFKKKGKKLNMGKSCVRFIKLEDLPLDVIGKIRKEHATEEIYRTVGSYTARSESAEGSGMRLSADYAD